MDENASLQTVAALLAAPIIAKHPKGTHGDDQSADHAVSVYRQILAKLQADESAN